jgi:hypothetical protein
MTNIFIVMKGKFKLLMAQLRAYKIDGLTVSCMNYNYDFEWFHSDFGYEGSKLTTGIKNIIIEILEAFEDKIINNLPETDSESYELFCNIYPNENKMELTASAEYLGESTDGSSFELDEDSKVKKYMNENGIETISAEYSGGGDSGAINEIYDNHGTPIESTEVEGELYDYLNSAFSGWEINEGSNGTIEVDGDEVSLEHIWFNYEWLETDFHMVITEETFV